MMSTIATHPKPRSASKRSSTSSSRAMIPIPEHHYQEPQKQQQRQRHSIRQKPRSKISKMEDDIPLALLAYKKGYTTIHPTIMEKQSTTGTNRSRESSTSRSILKQQQNTTDKQHRSSKSDMRFSNKKKESRNKFSSLSTPPPPPQLTKPHYDDHPDKKAAQPLIKHNEFLSTKLKRWFSLHRISNKIKSL